MVKRKTRSLTPQRTDGERDLLSHLETGYLLETDSPRGNPVLRRLKDDELIRPLIRVHWGQSIVLLETWLRTCIGDRYCIGDAIFEVTQPRVTCYRVGIRMNEPRMAALLVAHHRPGFYFRVLQEGEVVAGDDIVKITDGSEQISGAELDALLYLPGHLFARTFQRATATRDEDGPHR